MLLPVGHHVQEIGGVENAHDLVAEHVGGVAEVQDMAGGSS